MVSPLINLGHAIGNGFDWLGDKLGDVWSVISDFSSNVGSWISALSSDLASWFADLGSNLGTWFKNVGSNIASFSSSVGKWFLELGSDIGAFFSTLFSNIADFSKSVGTWFGDLFKKLGSWFLDVINIIGDVLAYINPFSDKFLLKIAFIPKDGFIDKKVGDLKDTVEDRFAFINQINDAFKSVTSAIESHQWQGIKATVPIINKEVTVISPTFVNFAANKLKAWIGGLIVVILLGYLFKRGSRIIGAGKG